MRPQDLPQEARDALRERFPGLLGPAGAGVRWKAAGGTTERLVWVGLEGGRLIAVISVNRQSVVVDDGGGGGGQPAQG